MTAVVTALGLLPLALTEGLWLSLSWEDW
ncbi:hypothetical protein ACN1C3_04935 [Pseudomonas sp. H11T01]